MAVQVTVVSPIEKNLGASFVTVTTPTESDANGGTSEMMFSSEDVASISIFFRVSSEGGVVSIIVIVRVVVAEFSEESIAVQVTIVSPSENTSGASLVIDEIDTKSEACA